MIMLGKNIATAGRRVGYVSAILLLVLGIGIGFTAPVYALDQAQRNIYDNSIKYYDFKDGGTGSSDCGSPDKLASLTFATPGGGGGGGPAAQAKTDVPADFTLGPLTDGAARRKKLMTQLIADFQFSPEQAAGIIGNFTQESGGSNLPPNVNQGGGRGAPTGSGGYGWAQWTGSRNVNFRDFGNSNAPLKAPNGEGTDAWDYAYLKWELQNGYAKTVAELKTKTTARDAAISFHATFEGSADGAKGIGERATDAEKALAEFNGTGSFDGGGAPTGSGAVDQLASTTTSGCPDSGGATGSVGSSAECGTSAECATKLLALAPVDRSGQIVLGQNAGLDAGVRSNLETAARGEQLTVCPPAVTLNATLLQILIRLSSKYKINLHNLSAPNHDCDNKFHPKGRAADVHLDGFLATPENLGTARYKEFAQDIMDLLPTNPNPNLGGGMGQAEYIGPLQNNKLDGRYFSGDGAGHIHMDVGSQAP